MNLNVGIIGFGKMGQIRFDTIKNSKIANVIAISEPNLNIETHLPNLSHDEIINHKNIDVIIICTPNFLNKELTMKSLKSNKHVFCEKPPAFTSKDVEEIIDSERKSNGRKLMYGFNHRHHESIIKMKSHILNQDFGNVIWMRGRYGKSVTKDYFNEWRADKNSAGGGILIDQGIHMLDLFLYLGGDFDNIKAEVSNTYWKSDIEDNVFAILKNNKTGVVASLHSTMTQWRHLFSLEVFLERGYMVLNGLITSSMSYGKEVLTIAKNRTTTPAATWKDEIKEEFTTNPSWMYELNHFFEAIENDSDIKIGNSKDALDLMKIIDEIYKQK